MIRGKTKKPATSPLRLLLWVAFAGLVFGVIGAGAVLEDLLRTSRNKLHVHSASGDIVLVALDDTSLQQVGRWPWPRRYSAKLADELTEAGAKRIFFDVTFENASDPADDAAFAKSLKQSGRVVLPIRIRSGLVDGIEPNAGLLSAFAKNVELATISFRYNYRNSVWQIPYALGNGGVELPSFAAKMANIHGPSGHQFRLDYSIDPSTIPTISAGAVLNHRIPASVFAGKDVVIGVTTEAVGDQYFVPGWGKMGGAYVHITGAETLKSGTPVDLGWLPAYLAAIAMCLAVVLRQRPLSKGLILASGLALLVLLPALLEARLVFVDITPALFVLTLMSSVLAWRGVRKRGLVNQSTGLPNLAALRSCRGGRKQALIVARVLNYAEIAESMPEHSEGQLVDQIVGRLTLGAPDRVIYQGDGGTFAWFENPALPFGNHLDAVYALFRNPAKVAGQQLDLAITFGVEIGSRRSLPNRLASAIVAAEKAAADGLKWKYHDPDTLQDASWKLSMMSQLDTAIDSGEVWVAFQPQLDLASGQVIGCEALARWTHPEKGPIAAMEFVAAAEQHDRIGKLTDFVFDTALAAGAQLNRKRPGFFMSVNLSAKLLSDRGLRLRIAAALARHGFPGEQLIVELTETAELGANGSAIDTLASIRDLGVTISIDDYGTGLSTLEYLKKVPAGEIKIDQSFVMGLMESRSDRLMVESTIALAHSLGRRVVAEGVQQRDVLDLLTAMDCDIAQGFIIGRPMGLETLLKRIGSRRRVRVA